MSIDMLATKARAMVAVSKGILAADEGPDVLANRFAPIAVPVNEGNARVYRTLLFGAPDVEQYLSGVILYDDALRMDAGADRRFPEMLAERGIIAGINADGGPHALAGSDGEFVTEGLDGLRGRLAAWHALGARFTKWRAAIRVGNGVPSRYAIRANAHALGRVAALSQEAGLVPIVEPDVMMTGDHDIEQCRAASEAAWIATYRELEKQRVVIEATVLKTNMVLPGADCPRQASAAEVGAATVESLRRCVPAAVPGIAFLSGGQSDLEATRNLNAINALGPQPWRLTFCYGRALQQPVLSTWRGQSANVAAAQGVFRHRCQMNALACAGDYDDEMEQHEAA